jgi:hypothetical protein
VEANEQTSANEDALSASGDCWTVAITDFDRIVSGSFGVPSIHFKHSSYFEDLMLVFLSSVQRYMAGAGKDSDRSISPG